MQQLNTLLPYLSLAELAEFCASDRKNSTAKISGKVAVGLRTYGSLDAGLGVASLCLWWAETVGGGCSEKRERGWHLLNVAKKEFDIVQVRRTWRGRIGFFP